MLSLTTLKLGDVTVFRCAGRIAAGASNILKEAVMNGPHDRIVVLDLAEVSAVDAAGLGALVSLQKWANANGARLKLMNLVPLVDEVLELTNLRSAFEVCSVEDMLDLLCRATKQPRFVTADAPLQWSLGRA
jgi:anti-anti-sigma factor